MDKSNKILLAYCSLILLAFFVLASNSQDDGRTFFSLDQGSVNLAGDGYDSDGTGTPWNYDGTGFFRIEVPSWCTITSVYTDDGVFFGISWDRATVATTEKAINYTVVQGDDAVFITDTATITLPTAVGIPGKIYILKNTGVGTVTIKATGAQTIDGDATVALGAQYDRLEIISNGANWLVITSLVTAP